MVLSIGIATIWDSKSSVGADKSPAGNQIVHLELPGNAHTLELTYSPDFELQVQEDLMHFAIGVPDIVEFCERTGEGRSGNLAR